MLPSPRNRCYKSLETDAEFRARLLKELNARAHRWRFDLEGAVGDFLDKFAWDTFMKQRKIVERMS